MDNTTCGLSYKELFPDDKSKAEAFDKIASMFYTQNFGTATKAEIELMMFSLYMDTVIESHNKDDVLDYNACSDYKISQILGIPQEKVRSLKVKKQARYPRKFDWRKSLESIKDQVVYDKNKNKLIIPLRDPNLYNEIRNFIEENGGYIEIQRGNNCIQIRPEYFFVLLYESAGNESEKKKIRAHFNRELKRKDKKNKSISIETDKELIATAISVGSAIIGILQAMPEILNGPLGQVFKAVFNL